MSKLIAVTFNVPEGYDCKTEVEWTLRTIDDVTLSDLDSDFEESINQYISDCTFAHNTIYEVIFKQVIEHDAGGAITGIYWNDMLCEKATF